MVWLALFIAVLLSGCSVGPNFVKPKAAVSPTWLDADDWRVKTGPAEYSNWWKAFNDPVLDRLIDQAYRGNLSLRVAGVRVLEARAQLGIAVGRLYPQAQQASGSLQDVGHKRTVSNRRPPGVQPRASREQPFRLLARPDRGQCQLGD